MLDAWAAGAYPAVMETEEVETLASLPQMHDPRLRLLQREAEFGQDASQRHEGAFGLPFAPAQHHQIVGVTHQYAAPARLPDPVEPVQVDVAEQRRDNTTLRRTGHAAPDRALLHQDLQGIVRRALRAKPKRALEEVGLEDRLDRPLQRRLHDPVADSRDRKRPLLRRTGLRDEDPARRQRSIALALQIRGQLVEQPIGPVPLDLRKGDPVDAGRAAIGAHQRPRPPQDVPAMDFVVERVEPSSGLGLGRPVERPLQFSDSVLLGGASLWVPRTPFGLSPDLDPGPARIPRAPASQSCQRLPSLYHARARIPDCFELPRWMGSPPRRVSVGFEERLSDSVLAQQAAEPVATAEEIELRQLSTWRRLIDRRLGKRRPLIERAVGPMRVVVLRVFADHVFEVAAADNQQSVEALAPNASDPALGVRPRLRRLQRCFDHPYAFGAEDLIEVTGELAVAVTDEKPRPDAFVAKLDQEVACLLGHPAAIRVGRDPGQVDAPGRKLDEKQHVEAHQEERVDGEEVALQDARRLRPQELAPVLLEPLRRRLDPRLLQNRPDGARG